MSGTSTGTERVRKNLSQPPWSKKHWMGAIAGNTLASTLPWYVGAVIELWATLCWLVVQGRPLLRPEETLGQWAETASSWRWKGLKIDQEFVD